MLADRRPTDLALRTRVGLGTCAGYASQAQPAGLDTDGEDAQPLNLTLTLTLTRCGSRTGGSGPRPHSQTAS